MWVKALLYLWFYQLFSLLLFFIFLKKEVKNLKIPISILSFVNDRFFISQEKSLDKINAHIFCSYNTIFFLLEQFGLIVKHGKTEVFHFSRLHGLFNPLSLDLSCIIESILYPKDLWRYLGFIFNKKLNFCQHIKYYSNKALSTVKCMKMLGNLIYRLLPYQKCLLYRICILSIILYGFLLWYYNKVPLSYLLNELNKIQWRAALWIISVFHTLLSIGIETIAGLIPIHLHLCKMSGRHQLWTSMLPYNHAIKLLLGKRHALLSYSHHLSLENMTSKQQQKIRSFIVDANNCLDGIFSSFDSLNSKFQPGLRLIDIFSSCLSFHKADYHSNESKIAHCNKLNELIFNTSLEPNTVVVVLDASIKNNIATSIAHVYFFNNLLKKTLYHAINITSMEAELFAIRCGIN